MIVDTCQCFGGPFPQPSDAPSPGRCTNLGERWATVMAFPTPARAAVGASRVVVWACLFHYEMLAVQDRGPTLATYLDTTLPSDDAPTITKHRECPMQVGDKVTVGGQLGGGAFEVVEVGPERYDGSYTYTLRWADGT